MEPDFKRLIFALNGRVERLEERLRFLESERPKREGEILDLKGSLAELLGMLEGTAGRLELRLDALEGFCFGERPPPPSDDLQEEGLG